MNRDFCPKT